MDKYTQYASIKSQIKDLEDKLKEIEPSIFKEVVDFGESVKKIVGTFTVFERKNYKFSETVNSFEKDMKDKITILKDEEIESGKAICEVSQSLRFTPAK